jgi:hypothetical protein
MKKLFLLFVVLAFSKNISAQSATELKTIENNVTDIKKNVGTFQKIEKNKTQGGYTNVYIKGGEVQLIETRSIEPSLEKNGWYYYLNGQMIYTENNWGDVTGVSVLQEKCYLENNKLVAWNKNGKTVNNTAPEFGQKESELVPYGQKLRSENIK